MELQKGQIVFSRRGRDVTHLYMVVEATTERVQLADGDKRTLYAPKKKNPHHISPTNTILQPEETDTDLKLKTALKAYETLHGPRQQGG